MDSTIDSMLYIPAEGVRESAVCMPLGAQRFRLESLAFFLEGVGFGDTFEAEQTSEGLQLIRVISRSGRKTLQILLAHHFRNSAALQEILRKVESNGGLWTQSGGLLSICMPAQATYDPAPDFELSETHER